VHDRRFVDAWRSGGFDVQALAADGTAPGQRTGVEWHSTLEDALATDPPDLVQAGPLTDVAPAVVERWQGPVLATSWGFDLMGDVAENPDARSAVTATLRRSALLVDNDAARDVALGLGAEADRMLVIPWGIDLDRAAPGQSHLRSRVSWERECVILSVRSHEPLYQVDLVVRAFVRAARSSTRLRLLVAGTGSQTAELRDVVRTAGLADRVLFLGELRADDLIDAYRAADLYVSASRTDGSSISLLEAMACRVPVCVSDIPGNHQWVTAHTGVTFGVADEATLAAEMERRAAEAIDDAARLRLVENAARLVRTRADWAANRRILVAAGRRLARREPLSA
jgi:glycosyltransferase involved in cell wall biosynthesis